MPWTLDLSLGMCEVACQKSAGNVTCLLILSLSAMDGVPFMISEKFACAPEGVSCLRVLPVSEIHLFVESHHKASTQITCFWDLVFCGALCVPSA